MSTATRRVLAVASVTICFGCLALQAIGVRTIHHSLIVTLIGIAFPVLGVLTGLAYLSSTRRQS